MLHITPDFLLLFNVAVCAILLMNALFLFALRGGRPVILIACVFLFSGLMPIGAAMQHLHSEFYMRAIFNPAHVIIVLAVFAPIYFYLFELMRPGSVRIRHWLAVSTPLVIYILLFFCISRSHPLPPFSSYDQITPYWSHPAMWVCLAGLFVAVVQQVLFAVITMRIYNEYKRRMVDEFSTFEGGQPELGAMDNSADGCLWSAYTGRHRNRRLYH